MTEWDGIFRKAKAFDTPQEDMADVIRFLKKEKARRVLDLGCGSGRHTALLAGAGFEVYATDISKEALKAAKKLLRGRSLKAKFKEASCYEKFPFKDNFFDAVISTQVIHHNRRSKIKFCISEIERVLKPGGVLFVTVAGKKARGRMSKGWPHTDAPWGSGMRGKVPKSKALGPNTFVPLEGKEKGIIHFLYNKKSMEQDFRNFEILDLHLDKGVHYCLLGRLKKK